MKPLLLLHGAIGAKDQFAVLQNEISRNFDVHTLNFSGHGNQPLPASDFSIKLFADEVVSYIESNNLKGTDVFGYSMGGYIALYIAANFPGYINRIFTLATKFNWSPEIARKEITMLNPLTIKSKVPAFARTLSLRHGEEKWEALLEKTTGLMRSLGDKNVLNNDLLNKINNRVQIGIGDKDKMVTIEESLNVYRQLKNGTLYIMPQTAHPIEQANTKQLAFQFKLFFNT